MANMLLNGLGWVMEPLWQQPWNHHGVMVDTFLNGLGWRMAPSRVGFLGRHDLVGALHRQGLGFLIGMTVAEWTWLGHGTVKGWVPR